MKGDEGKEEEGEEEQRGSGLRRSDVKEGIEGEAEWSRKTIESQQK